MWGSKLARPIILLVVIFGVFPIVLYLLGVQSYISEFVMKFLVNQGLANEKQQLGLYAKISSSYYYNIIGWASFVISLVTGLILFLYLKVKEEVVFFFIGVGLILSGLLVLYLSQIEFGLNIVAGLSFHASVFYFTFSMIFSSFVLAFSLLSYYGYCSLFPKNKKEKRKSKLKLCFHLFFLAISITLLFLGIKNAFSWSKLDTFLANKRFIHEISLFLLMATIYVCYRGLRKIPVYFGMSIIAFLSVEIILQVYVIVGVSINSESLVNSALILEPAAYIIPLFGVLFHFMHRYKVITKESDSAISKVSEKNRFIVTCVHDLKNPLAVIKQSSALLAESIEKSSKTQKSLFEILESNTDFSLNLVSDLLTLISSEVIHADCKLEKMNLDILLVKVLKGQKLLADKKKIKIHFDCDKENAFAFIHSVKMEEVINNLVSNAIKFSEEGSEIFVKRKRLQHKMVIQINDQGIGISKEEQKELFTPFSKGHRKGTANEKGSGLGLAIAKEHMKDQKGNLRILSKSGKGTTAIIELPFSAKGKGQKKGDALKNHKKAVNF